MKDLPKISIITPSYQQADFLEETIKSVLDQGYPDLEYIIIDGGSTDGSVDIIKKYEEHLHYWVSEKDNGQSDAINKGLEQSSGKVFNWLNSDDRLAQGALNRVGEAFAADPDLVCFGGQIHHFDEKGSKLFNMLNDPSDLEQMYCDPVINQMATFYNADVARSCGVNSSLHYAMDLYLWLNVLFEHGTAKMKFVHEHLADFRLHKDQKTEAGSSLFVSDTANILAGMAIDVQEEELAEILLIGHEMNDNYKNSIQVFSEHKKILFKMIVHFMLKWHHKIYTAEELQMMKAFVQWVESKGISIPEMHTQRFENVKEASKASNWLTFRLKRKMKHLGS